MLAKGVTVKFFKEGLTVQNHGTQDPFAEFKRNIIRERQRERIERTKEAGKYKHGKGGRKQTIDRAKVQELRAQGVSFRKIADQIDCSLSSVQRCLDESQG